MQFHQADVAIIGAGGAGLRAAIEVAEQAPHLTVALISKVYPMRSHTVAAEGGSAGVVQSHDHLNHHFDDTVSGGDWLCDQKAVEYFVSHCTEEMVQLEHWGCPWSRQSDGNVAVRAFGGMKIERTWYAADKTGFHILHTLFQTSMKYPSIRRFDEHFCLDLLIDNGRVGGVLTMDLAQGEPCAIRANSVIIATGGAGRVYQHNTNGGIVTGDGMALAYRHGVALRDMEFVQYHPTGLPGTGVLMTEGCRGEGGTLVNKDGYRYLQDYGLGPESPAGETANKQMELGPRDKVSQSFYHEQQKGRTIKHPDYGDVVYLDLRHLGEAKINERLPFIRELAKSYVNVDPVFEPIPVRPAVHYTMGGILTDIDCKTSIPGLFAVGECASVGIHGANRLGSNSLAELSVFGKVAGIQAACHAQKVVQDSDTASLDAIDDLAQASWQAARAVVNPNGTESLSELRMTLGQCMEEGLGIYRSEDGMQKVIDTLESLTKRFQNVRITDTSYVFNTQWLAALEFSALLDVAKAMAYSAISRKESRGAHQRLDDYNTRDDERFLCHSVAYFQDMGAPRIDYQPVTITKSPPDVRKYGAEAKEEVNQ